MGSSSSILADGYRLMATVPPPEDPVRADPESPQTMAVFARTTSSVGGARGWLTSFLRANNIPPAIAADAVLLVSELVTNALRHGLGDIVTRGALVNGELRIAVTDSGTGLPDLRPVDPGRVGGVGLRIVDRLADDWGVAPFPGGKTVWATLASTRP
jgi:anti-sigma regulatory factor (Ser/Thr protein kinase)